MRSIAHQSHAPKSPTFDRIAIDHGIFQQHLGTLQQRRHVQPVKAPAFIYREKIFELARLVPVVLGFAEQRNLACPVHQLRSLSIDIAHDRIDHQLAGSDGADANIGVAVENRFVPRNASPGVDPLKPQVFVRIELTAYRGIDSVTCEHDGCAHRR